MRRSLVRVLALVAALAIIATACGSNRSDENSSGSSPSTTEAPPSSGNEMFGDLPSPCGKGEGTPKPSTDQGVTATSVKIGYGDDAGYKPAPGTSHEASDAIRALVKWCNDQGGINGRTIEPIYYDAAITEVANRITEACRDVFMLVGEAWSLDAGQEDIRLQCKLPAVPTISVSSAFTNAPLMYSPVPNPVDKLSIGNAYILAKKFPDKVKKAAVMYGNYPATIDSKDKVLATYPKAGFTFLPCPQAYNILGESDWKPFVQKLKDCGVEALYFGGAPYPNFENLLEAAQQLNWKPIYILEGNFYIDSFRQWNSKGLADTGYIRDHFVPFEQADSNPATKKYVDLVKRDGGDTASLGVQAASAFLLWATAAKDCDVLTRQCVLDNLAKVHKWTAGGLHAKTNPGDNLPADCVMVLKLQGTKFVQFHPEKQGEFDCSPTYIADVTGRVVDQAKLGPDRRTTAHGTGK